MRLVSSRIAGFYALALFRILKKCLKIYRTSCKFTEEVFASGNALWLSNDGLRLAIASFDDTAVDEVMHFQYGDAGSPESQYPELVELRYPKV